MLPAFPGQHQETRAAMRQATAEPEESVARTDEAAVNET